MDLRPGDRLRQYEIEAVLGAGGMGTVYRAFDARLQRAVAIKLIHAQSEPDPARHAEAARRGAWVEFDGVAPGQVEKHLELVLAMRRAGLLLHVLVSHDAGWYHVGEPGGGTFRGFELLFAEFLPALRRAGVTDGEIRTLLVDNPRRALAPRRRLEPTA